MEDETEQATEEETELWDWEESELSNDNIIQPAPQQAVQPEILPPAPTETTNSQALMQPINLVEHVINEQDDNPPVQQPSTEHNQQQWKLHQLMTNKIVNSNV